MCISFVTLKINDFVLHKQVKKQIEKLQGVEKFIIYGLYNEVNHAYNFPMNDPTVNLLLARKYLFTYDQTADLMRYGMQFGITYALQPIVVDSVQKILTDQVKKLKRIEYKLKNCKKEDYKKSLTRKKAELQQYLKEIGAVSLKNIYEPHKSQNFSNEIY